MKSTGKRRRQGVIVGNKKRQLLCELELRQLEEARAARPPALESVHHEDPGSANARACYKLNRVSIRGRGRSGDPEISVIRSGNR